MVDTQLTMKIDYYLRLIVRRRWFVIIPLVISMIVGSYYAITLTRIYSAKTSILVEAQSVPKNYVQSLVSIDINARISTISQQILSWTNLEKIIKGFQLYSKPEHKEMFMEDKVGSLRKRINVSLARTRGKGTDAFSISFRGSDPEKVMKIANALATFFIDENLKVREAQAIGTSTFLEDELNTIRKKLVTVEAAMRDFRKRYMGELPEQLEPNLRVLESFQLALSEKGKSLVDARNRLIDINNIIRAMQDGLEPEVMMKRAGAPAAPQSGSEEEIHLATLKKQLSLIQSRYTGRHPDVVKLKRLIAGLEGEISGGEKEIPKVSFPEDSPAEVSSAPEKKVDIMLLSQRNSVRREIDYIKGEMSDLQGKIKIYATRVENAPKREQEFLALKRDYDNIQNQYTSLLDRRLEAEIAVNMERKQKGEQFRILDPARLPQKPIEPNMPRLFFLTLAIGLGVGGGIIFLLDFFDTSFKSPSDIETTIGIPVLAMIPTIRDSKYLKRRRINLVLSFFSIAATLILLAGFAVLVFHGIDETRAAVGRFIRI